MFLSILKVFCICHVVTSYLCFSVSNRYCECFMRISAKMIHTSVCMYPPVYRNVFLFLYLYGAKILDNTYTQALIHPT